MAVPNFKSIVQDVFNSGRFDLSTLEGCGAFTRACAGPLHKADKRIVMLKKEPSRTHVVDSKGRLHAADAVLFVDNGEGQSIDIIGKSRTPEAKPAWTVDIVRYTDADGFVPDYDEVEPPAPTPPSSDLKARVEALEARIVVLEMRLDRLRDI